MALAASIGIPAAHAEARSAGGRPYLLVERYDRRTNSGGIVVRIHQEDACQALGIGPERKYASEGGPAFRDLFRLVRTYVRQPAPAVLSVLDVAIFNLAVGNADAHGKNFSFLLDQEGPRMAPFYDLLSTIHWPELTSRMAMRYGEAGTIDEMGSSVWLRFSESAGVTERLVRQRVKRVTESILKAVERGSQGSAISKAIAERTKLRASRLLGLIS
jgi:serine/threonine-protein kinase HipA